MATYYVNYGSGGEEGDNPGIPPQLPPLTVAEVWARLMEPGEVMILDAEHVQATKTTRRREE